MSEINKNDLNFIKSTSFKANEKKVEDEVVSAEKNEVTENKKALTDSLEKAEMIGRSQVQKSDSLENDIKIAKEKPEFVEMSNEISDNYYNQLVDEGVTEPYEKSCAMTEATKKELL